MRYVLTLVALATFGFVNSASACAPSCGGRHLGDGLRCLLEHRPHLFGHRHCCNPCPPPPCATPAPVPTPVPQPPPPPPPPVITPPAQKVPSLTPAPKVEKPATKVEVKVVATAPTGNCANGCCGNGGGSTRFNIHLRGRILGR